MDEATIAAAAVGEPEGRVLEPMTAGEALRLLAEVPYGRLVFVRDGEPAIVSLNHIVDGGDVVIRTDHGAGVVRAIDAGDLASVVYQADQMDCDRRLGWTVSVRGWAIVVTEAARRRRCESLLRPWLAKTNDVVVAVRPQVVTGRRIVASTPGSAA